MQKFKKKKRMFRIHGIQDSAFDKEESVDPVAELTVRTVSVRPSQY